MGCELDRKRKNSSGCESGKKIKKVKSSSTRVDNGVDSKLQNELWNAIIPGDDKLIDDTRKDPADHYENDNERSVSVKAKEEVDDEVERLFKGFGRRKKKPEKSAEELGMFVEHRMAEFELAAESDAELNLDKKPAINKLDKLPLLMDVLSKKPLQLEFLDRGVLTLLKNWLEPLPDGSLPNITVRSGILKILTDFRLDLEEFDRREQLKRSGLGKTAGNRKLAKDLVDKWSRPIFNKSTRFEDTRKYLDDDRVLYRKPPVKRITHKTAMLDFKDTDDLDEFKRERKSGELSSSKQHASKPEAAPLDFMVRPQSKIDPDEIRARAKQVEHDKCRAQIHKKLRQLKAPKKKLLQASKLNAEGRDMIKFF
ncbi:hypothetical protein MKW98_023809 [Papaver atlanticum]|uniref:TFIIS N-terminal domain-containing protein n=1 Tax=Papaver atlanticum TaxID=357466 RepID=A0AAD4XN22_9MAGN|nr:hypothetical protein MKW98_023809 [Papaver atlanticum]